MATMARARTTTDAVDPPRVSTSTKPLGWNWPPVDA